MLANRKSLRLFDQARLDCLCADPLTLYCAACRTYADALHIGFESALCLLYELQTDTAALFALTFMDDGATLYRTLACN